MFTGLIEHLSVLSSITPTTSSEGFTFLFTSAAPILVDCHIGDSIQINGACLTVTEFTDDSFKVGLAPETLSRTNLGDLKVGDHVNCERAMSAHTRFGGHFVQGHVDTTATIISKIPDGNSIRFTFQLPENTPYMNYLIEKGYVTIDGASLTLTQVSDKDRSFGIMLISHSQEKLTLTSKVEGEKVNVEFDCVGKYILGGEGGKSRIEEMVEGLVERKLKERGL
ncbi:riboflavin synthase, partial [Tremellales sp. Uapishka_1]